MPQCKKPRFYTLARWMRAMAANRQNDAATLIDDIEAEFAVTADTTGRDSLSAPVRAAIAKVPRERFVPPSEQALAYLNCPLPIGHGQTISQPYIVAIMTDLLDLQPTDSVLEIGTGCGYQTAILAEIARHVASIEVVQDLAHAARERLNALGYRNIALRIGDGAAGWPELAPFDAIIVTAAAAQMPAALIGQLKPGGRMVIPIGTPGGPQTLMRVDKRPDGTTTQREILPVAFVPLV
jgi:protein-L-isoaspartate(D-aspartate) O-methyltransferase